MWGQGQLGTGSGLRRPAGEWWDALPHTHTHTHTINWATRGAGIGTCSACWAQGRRMNLDEWSNTLDWTSSSMNKRLGGLVPGSGWLHWASCTMVSISQVAAPTIRGTGMIGSRSAGAASQERGEKGHLVFHSLKRGGRRWYIQSCSGKGTAGPARV